MAVACVADREGVRFLRTMLLFLRHVVEIWTPNSKLMRVGSRSRVRSEVFSSKYADCKKGDEEKYLFKVILEQVISRNLHQCELRPTSSLPQLRISTWFLNNMPRDTGKRAIRGRFGGGFASRSVCVRARFRGCGFPEKTTPSFRRLPLAFATHNRSRKFFQILLHSRILCYTSQRTLARWSDGVPQEIAGSEKHGNQSRGGTAQAQLRKQHGRKRKLIVKWEKRAGNTQRRSSTSNRPAELNLPEKRARKEIYHEEENRRRRCRVRRSCFERVPAGGLLQLVVVRLCERIRKRFECH